MTTDVKNQSVFDQRTDETLRHLKDTGQLKSLQMIEGPMDATVSLRGRGDVACFCSKFCVRPTATTSISQSIFSKNSGAVSGQKIANSIICRANLL